MQRVRAFTSQVLGALLAVALSGAAVGAEAAPKKATLTYPQVAAAAETRNLPVLRRALADEAFLASLVELDPEAAIELRLSVAEALIAAGDKRTALTAYEAALGEIARIRGKNDPQQIDLLRKIAGLKAELGDLKAAATDMDRALDVADLAWGAKHESMPGLKAEADRAWRAYRAADPNAAPRPLRFASRAAATEQYDQVDIFYATHRRPTGDPDPLKFYKGQRGPMAYGKATVSVPRNRATGEVPRPSIWKLEFRPNPEKHIILTSVKQASSREAFFGDLTGRIGASDRKEVFVFIHGFNSTFEAAAVRTAQLAADLSIDGAPILYSWASKSSALGYKADAAEADVPAHIEDLANFLADVQQKTGAERMHLVGYSLGSRILTNALEHLSKRPAATRPQFDEVVLAAPDVAAEEFQARWPRLRPMGKRYTLYASKRDLALLISGQYNGKQRLGDARKLTLLDGVQTIDTTAARGGLLGHADFVGNALDDFRSVIWYSLAPSKRCILQADTAGGRPYWLFAAGARNACSDNEFREVVSLVRRTGSPDKALAELQAKLAAPGQPEDRTLLERVRQQLIATYGVATGQP